MATPPRAPTELQHAFIAWIGDRGVDAERLLQGPLDLSPRYCFFEKSSSQYATEFYARVERWRRWVSGLITGIRRRVVHSEHLVRDAENRFAETHLLTFTIVDFNNPAVSKTFDLQDRARFSTGSGYSELREWFRGGREEPTWIQVRQALLKEVQNFVEMIRDQADELTLVEEKVSAQPAPAQPPDQTERFVDLERRGEGAHASVWKARDTNLDRIVALRIVRPSAGGDEEAIAHARTMAKPPQHPNIVTVYELVAIRDPSEQRLVVAAVMEFVDGEKLRVVLKRILAASDAIKVCTGILVALTQYHDQGLAHLDLHLDNVLISGAMDAKVLDPKTYRTDLFATTQLRQDQISRDVRDAASLLRDVLRSSGFDLNVPATFYQLAGEATSVNDLQEVLDRATKVPIEVEVSNQAVRLADSFASIHLADPTAVFTAALRLARANDLLGWKHLEGRLRRDYVARLPVWRRDQEPRWAGDRDKDGGIAATNALLDIAMPRFVFSLVGVYSKNPALVDQRRVIEDLLSIADGWPDGTAAIVNAPRTLVYLFHYVHGALCMIDGQFDEALQVDDTQIPDLQRSRVGPLWRARDMTGWPLLLGGNFKRSWEYVCALRQSRPVLEELFPLQNDFDVGIAAYSMLLSVLELATGSAKGKPDLSNIENIQLDVPPLFISMSHRVLEQAVARTIGNRDVVEHVARRSGANIEAMRAIWPTWKRLLSKFWYDRGGDFDEVTLGELAPMPTLPSP